MQTLTVTPEQLRSIATIVHAASKDVVTPAITMVQLRRDGDSIIATATDRFRVAELRTAIVTTTRAEVDGIEGNTDVFEALIPAATLTAAVKGLDRRVQLGVAFLLDEEEGIITIRGHAAHGFSVSARTSKLMFPPVARLFPEGEITPAEGAVALKPAFLATIDKLHLPHHEREQAWHMQTQNGDSYNTSKPRPVLFTIEDKGTGDTIRYMVQPNLLLR